MKGVVIREIELINYRLFVNARLNFNPTDKKNVSVVEGTNGFGKSNLFNAINWCFFDTEPHLRQDSEKLPVCNTGVLKALKCGGTVETIVRIVLDTPVGEKRLERVLVTRKTTTGEHTTLPSAFSVTEKVGKEWRIAPNPDYAVSRIVPQAMRHFFFIDGEMLREMFLNISPDKIRDSIFDLSQVTLLQKAIEHLDAYATVVRKEGGPDRDQVLQYAEDALQLNETHLAEAKTQLDKEKTDLETARANKRRLDAELEEVDYPAARRLEEQRKATETAIVDTEKNLEDNKKLLCEVLFDVAPVVMLQDAVSNTLGMLEALKRANKLPPDYQATFIQKLLDENECICGTDLADKKNKQKRDRLVTLLKECDEPDFLSQANALFYRLAPLRKQPEKALNRLHVTESKIAQLDTKLLHLQKALKDISTKLGDIDVERVKTIHLEREKYESAIRQCDGRIGQLEIEMKKLAFQKTEAEKVVRRMMDKQKRLKLIGERIDACRHTQACLQQIMATLMNEIRVEAEEGTQKYFSHLVSAKQFSPPRIDKNYNLIVEKDGYNAVTSLSAAETLCMGYSFMAALRNTSGFSAPIVIDTPLAKISTKYRSNVATWMKEALDQTQIILLVSDVEYTSEFRSAITRFVADELMLVCHEKGNYSEVVNYAK